MVKSNFKCKKCEFATTRKDVLNTHIAFWHIQDKVKCPECPAEFSGKGNMELHRRITHPKDTLASTPNQDCVEEERGKLINSSLNIPIMLVVFDF